MLERCRSIIHCCILTLVLFEAVAADAGKSEPKVINIGSRRELFVDRFIVSELKGASLKLHTPQLMQPVSAARPHGHYATVLKADDKFQFYYRGDTKAGNHWKKGWEQYHEGEVTLYAESRDAINWILPRLGIYDDHPTFPKHGASTSIRRITRSGRIPSRLTSATFAALLRAIVASPARHRRTL